MYYKALALLNIPKISSTSSITTSSKRPVLRSFSVSRTHSNSPFLPFPPYIFDATCASAKMQFIILFLTVFVSYVTGEWVSSPTPTTPIVSMPTAYTEDDQDGRYHLFCGHDCQFHYPEPKGACIAVEIHDWWCSRGPPELPARHFTCCQRYDRYDGRGWGCECNVSCNVCASPYTQWLTIFHQSG